MRNATKGVRRVLEHLQVGRNDSAMEQLPGVRQVSFGVVVVERVGRHCSGESRAWRLTGGDDVKSFRNGELPNLNKKITRGEPQTHSNIWLFRGDTAGRGAMQDVPQSRMSQKTAWQRKRSLWKKNGTKSYYTS